MSWVHLKALQPYASARGKAKFSHAKYVIGMSGYRSGPDAREGNSSGSAPGGAVGEGFGGATVGVAICGVCSAIGDAAILSRDALGKRVAHF